MATDHRATWERRQAELWERIFQATQDVVSLAESLSTGTGIEIVKEAVVRSAMAVGAHLVRANATDDRASFMKYLTEARLQAIETDYWLRMSYVLQQRDELQRDVSSVINQFATIIDLLHTFSRHAAGEPDVIARHTRGPRVN
jgi:four helix bundle protein